MPTYDSMKKNMESQRQQNMAAQIQDTRQQEDRGISIAREYARAMEREASMNRELLQGPPPNVVKKGRWVSKKKKALETLRGENRHRFGSFLERGSRMASEVNREIRSRRENSDPADMVQNERNITDIFREKIQGTLELAEVIRQEAHVPETFLRIRTLLEHMLTHGAEEPGVVSEFLQLKEEKTVVLGPSARFLTGENGSLFAGEFSVKEKPEAFQMLLFHCLTTALVHCVDAMDPAEINMEAFAKLRAAAIGSGITSGELLKSPAWYQKRDSKEVQEEARRKAREEEKTAEAKQNAEQIERFLQKGDIYTETWAKDLYGTWLKEALKNSLASRPQVFSRELVRAKERMDARLAEIRLLMQGETELSLDMPMLLDRQCVRLAELVGTGRLNGEMPLDKAGVKQELEKLSTETSAQREHLRKRQKLFQEKIPQLTEKDWKDIWKAPELQKLILHTEDDEAFARQAEQIRKHAQVNESILQELAAGRGLSVGADLAVAEIRRQLGARWLIGPFAGVELDAGFYMANLNTYVPEAFVMERKFRDSLKRYGFSDAMGPAVAALLKKEPSFLADEKKLEQSMKDWKALSEKNSAWLLSETEKKKLSRAQWDELRSLENQQILLDEAAF